MGLLELMTSVLLFFLDIGGEAFANDLIIILVHFGLSLFEDSNHDRDQDDDE